MWVEENHNTSKLVRGTRLNRIEYEAWTQITIGRETIYYWKNFTTSANDMD